MTTIDCKICEKHLPDLLLDPQEISPEAAAHVAACPRCQAEIEDLRATMAFMDLWSAPEPTPFFDTRLRARIREEESRQATGVWHRFGNWLSGGRSLRPALAGALGLAMLVGGGTAATWIAHHHSGPMASPTVNDLKIYDNNAQAVDQMDLLDGTGNTADGMPQS